MNKYNLNQAVKVELLEESHNKWVKFKKEIKIFGFTFRKEGVFCAIFNSRMKELPPFNSIVNGKVMTQARVAFYFSNDHTLNVHFESMKEAVEYYEDTDFTGMIIND